MIRTRVGDIFSVEISGKQKKFFQLAALDLTQLNSDVIRAFKRTYAVGDRPDLREIINDEVDFYAHCVTKFGVKMKLWEKVGNIEDVGDTRQILFRDTNDYGAKPGRDPVSGSHNWYVWRINDDAVTRVGRLEGEYRQAEIGIVVNPYDVVERMKTGKYSFVYPMFE